MRPHPRRRSSRVPSTATRGVGSADGLGVPAADQGEQSRHLRACGPTRSTLRQDWAPPDDRLTVALSKAWLLETSQEHAIRPDEGVMYAGPTPRAADRARAASR